MDNNNKMEIIIIIIIIIITTITREMDIIRIQKRIFIKIILAIVIIMDRKNL